MSAKFEPRFNRNPMGPPFLIVCSIPRILSVTKNFIAEIFRELTKILLTFACLNSTLLSSFGLMSGQTSSFSFTFPSSISDSLEISCRRSKLGMDGLRGDSRARCFYKDDAFFAIFSFFKSYLPSCQAIFFEFPFNICYVSINSF